MRSLVVVSMTPVFGHAPNLVERGEHEAVQHFGAEGAVEAFDVGVLGGLAGLVQHQPDVVGAGPLIQSPAGEPWALVGPDGRRIAAEAAYHPQDVGDALAIDSASHREPHGFLGAVLDHCEAFDRSAVGRSVMPTPALCLAPKHTMAEYCGFLVNTVAVLPVRSVLTQVIPVGTDDFRQLWQEAEKESLWRHHLVRKQAVKSA